MLIYCLIAGFLSKWQHNISNESVENLKLHLLLKEGINQKKQNMLHVDLLMYLDQQWTG